MQHLKKAIAYGARAFPSLGMTPVIRSKHNNIKANKKQASEITAPKGPRLPREVADDA